MSFGSMLDRDILGSARATIDANSNTNLTSSVQQNTYRTLYTGATPSPYTPYTPYTPLTCPCLTTGAPSNNDSDLRKLLNDVKKFFG